MEIPRGAALSLSAEKDNAFHREIETSLLRRGLPAGDFILATVFFEDGKIEASFLHLVSLRAFKLMASTGTSADTMASILYERYKEVLP